MLNPRHPDLQARPGRWGWSAALALLLLHVVWLRGIPVNSDEPQHLHVVWAWTQGLLPYRDVFDNHTPLFHVLLAPVLALVGETPHVLTWMRLAMVPLALVMLWCTWRLGTALWGARTGLWAAALTVLFPEFFLFTGQFRTDVLWAALWLGAWTVALVGRWSARRRFSVGLLVGAAFAVSMKTSLLVAGTALGALMLLLAHGRWPGTSELRRAARDALGLGAGLLLVPALVVAYFFWRGAAGDLWYCVVQHNLVPELGRSANTAGRMLLLPVVLGLMWWLTRHVLARTHDRANTLRALVLLLAAGSYALLLYVFWPLITQQDFLPVLPVIALGAVALIAERGAWSTWLLTLALAAELGLLLIQHPPWHHPDAAFRQELRILLALTSHDDYVMDAKGSTIFRQRPWYHALEGITDARLRLGLIVDDLPQRLVQTDTKVVVLDRLHGDDLAFVNANYLRVHGRIAVAGKRFDGMRVGEPRRFELAIAAPYAVMSLQGTIGTILIDGQAYVLPRNLSAGPHSVEVEQDGDYALVWNQAVMQGLTPFAFGARSP